MPADPSGSSRHPSKARPRPPSLEMSRGRWLRWLVGRDTVESLHRFLAQHDNREDPQNGPKRHEHAQQGGHHEAEHPLFPPCQIPPGNDGANCRRPPEEDKHAAKNNEKVSKPRWRWLTLLALGEE